MRAFITVALTLTLCQAHVIKRATGDQNPKVWDALRILRGGKDLSVEDQQNLLINSVAGEDYPDLKAIPQSDVLCSSFRQPGYYADDSNPSQCQVFHRCDLEGQRTDYICPSKTLFNQITLICDWFFNVDCSVSRQFQDYSNSRLNQDNVRFLDDQLELRGATGVEPVAAQRSMARSGPVMTTTAAPSTTTAMVATSPPITVTTAASVSSVTTRSPSSTQRLRGTPSRNRSG